MKSLYHIHNTTLRVARVISLILTGADTASDVFSATDTFAAMKLLPRLERNITETDRMNIKEPTQIQAKSVPVLLSGVDAFIKVEWVGCA